MAIFSGSTAPSACYLGSILVSAVYSGSTQIWPVVSSSTKLTIASTQGSTASFSGNGTSGNAFTRSTGFNTTDANGLYYYSWTATANCTVFVSFDFSDDDDNGWQASVTRDNVRVNIGSNPTQNPVSPTFYGPATGITGSLSATSGQVIRIVSNAPVNSGIQTGQFFSNVSIYAT